MDASNSNVRVSNVESVFSTTNQENEVMFSSMSDLRAKNKKIGHLFFDHDTMKFWGSKIETDLFRGIYFITSEKGVNDNAPRHFSIRQARPSGEIITVGKLGAYKSLDEAKDAVKVMIKSLKLFKGLRKTNGRKTRA